MKLSRNESRAYYAYRLPKARRTQSGELRGPCPIHKGKQDSFAIDPESGLWFCHSGCGRGGSAVDLEMALTGRDFRDAAAAVREIAGCAATTTARRPVRAVVAEYTYRDEHGAPLYRVVRTEPKGFYQQRWSGVEWVNGIGQTRRVLYRLPEVLEAAIVFVVEGEKDVETLRKWGFTASTTSGGSGAKWLPEFTDALRGREVIVIPDNDGPGWERAVSILRELVGNVARLRLYDLPAETKDITDWFAAGHSEVELIATLEGVHAV
ncbi:MAG: CHC2 zinc finger domain-containing protein [Acidobacteria bacterium]|nr:CHC2 zinc finger domain-containing protein [Acidobacteriota bacterium]